MSYRLLFFTADDCAPCKSLKKSGALEKIAALGVKIVVIDVDKATKLSTLYDIFAVPTLVLEAEDVGPVPTEDDLLASSYGRLPGAVDKALKAFELGQKRLKGFPFAEVPFNEAKGITAWGKSGPVDG